MKIVKVEAFAIDGPLEKPWKIATATMASLTAVVVRVTAEDGTVGVGEAIARVGTRVLVSVVEDILKPVVEGKDAFAVEAIWEAMYATLRARGHTRGFLLEAMSGVDIAIWDLLGRSLNLPVAQLLGGHGRKQLDAYASSVLIDAPEPMAAVARELREEGYRAIKLKVAGKLEMDIERVKAVRKAVGDEITLMLDANSGFDVVGAIGMARAAEDLGVFWLEEPLYLDNLPGYAQVKRHARVRIAAGEGEFTAAGFREFIHDGLLDIVQPNVCRCGGFTGGRRIANLAQSYGVPIAPHTGASGPLCIAATLQFAASITGFLTHEHMFLDNSLAPIFKEGLPRPRNGVIDVPQGPGLGVEVDWEAVDRFRIG
ncbi:MAG: mandelate racemase/muconate lactonizing enzyme family protein [Lautropia sp.]